MPRNGAGVFLAPSSSWNPPVNLALATAADWAALLADLEAAITQSVSRDGQTPIIGAWNQGNQRIIALAPGTALTDAANAQQVQDGTLTYLTTVGGTNNAITAAAPIVMSAYATGAMYRFVAVATNNGATSLNVNGIGVKNVYFNGLPMTGGEIGTGIPSLVMYDGTRFHLIGGRIGDGYDILSYQTASSVLTLDFAPLNDVYQSYELEFDLIPTMDDTYLFAVVGTGAGPTWQDGGGSYSYGARVQAAQAGADAGSVIDAVTSRVPMTHCSIVGQGAGNAAGEHCVGKIVIQSPAVGGRNCNLYGTTSYQRAGDGTTALYTYAGAYYGGATPTTGIQLAFSGGGSIASGEATLRGRRR